MPEIKPLNPEIKKRLLLAQRRQTERKELREGADMFALQNSKRRVRELIEHLEKKFTPAAGQ